MGRIENLNKAQDSLIKKGVSPKVFVKGSPEAKEYMAKLRSMRKTGPGSRRGRKRKYSVA